MKAGPQKKFGKGALKNQHVKYLMYFSCISTKFQGTRIMKLFFNLINHSNGDIVYKFQKSMS